MRQVRFLRGWTGTSMARFSTGDVAAFSDGEAAIIVAAEAAVYHGEAASMMVPPQDKMIKEPMRKKALA